MLWVQLSVLHIQTHGIFIFVCTPFSRRNAMHFFDVDNHTTEVHVWAIVY